MHERIGLKNAESVRPKSRLLYLTVDGALEPLGRSQVVSYLVRLSDRGYRYTLVSLEREVDLVNSRSVHRLRQELQEHDIRWEYGVYRGGGALWAVFKNCLTALRIAFRNIRKGNITLIHARAHVPAMIAWTLHIVSGVPYIFDMRGYWIDERVAEGRWFTHVYIYKLAKRFEATLLKASAGIVVLTQIIADDLRAGPLRNSNFKPLAVIPTSTDYDEFNFRNKGHGAVPAAVKSRLNDSLVIGWVGSINASYYLHESVLLFRYILEQTPTAHFLALTHQSAQLESALANHGIPKSAYTIATVPHSEIAGWISQMDWGLLLVSTSHSKRGSVPTKLAEFLASEVRPIQYGCNPEVAERVKEAGTGLVLGSLSENDLRQAALEIAGRPRDRESTKIARDLTRAYFGIEAAVDRYAVLLDDILLEKAS